MGRRVGVDGSTCRAEGVSAAAGKLSLAGLDEASPFAVDSRIFAENIAALRTVAPRFSDALSAVVLPAHWRAVVAIDGWPTWRVEQPGNPPAWLWGTAAPEARARAVVQQGRFGEANVLLPGIGTGAELCLALKCLSQRQAALVFESDLEVLAAVLRINLLDAALRERRCILLEPPDCEASLRGLLDRHSGLLAPTILLLTPGVSSSRVAEARALCERAALDISRARQERLSHLQKSRSGEGRTKKNTLALLARQPDSEIVAASDALGAAATEAGMNFVRCVADRPLEAGALAHSERISAELPSLVIGIDCGREALPIETSSTWAQWHTQRQTPAKSASFHLACCPLRRAELQTEGLASRSVIDFFWASEAAPAPAAECGGPVLFAEVQPDLSAVACGISQATHQTLWSGVLQSLRSEIAGGRTLSAEGFLIAGERNSGVQLREESLRGAFVEIIASRGLPGVLLEAAGQALSLAGIEFLGIGNRQSPGGPPGTTSAPPCAIVSTSLHDLWTPAVARFASRGAPLLVLEYAGGQAAARLEGVLEPGRHYALVRNPADLPRAIESLRRDEAAYRRRRERLFAHMAEKHRWSVRLATLAARIAEPA